MHGVGAFAALKRSRASAQRQWRPVSCEGARTDLDLSGTTFRVLWWCDVCLWCSLMLFHWMFGVNLVIEVYNLYRQRQAKLWSLNFVACHDEPDTDFVNSSIQMHHVDLTEKDQLDGPWPLHFLVQSDFWRAHWLLRRVWKSTRLVWAEFIEGLWSLCPARPSNAAGLCRGLGSWPYCYLSQGVFFVIAVSLVFQRIVSDRIDRRAILGLVTAVASLKETPWIFFVICDFGRLSF